MAKKLAAGVAEGEGLGVGEPEAEVDGDAEGEGAGEAGGEALGEGTGGVCWSSPPVRTSVTTRTARKTLATTTTSQRVLTGAPRSGPFHGL